MSGGEDSGAGRRSTRSESAYQLARGAFSLLPILGGLYLLATTAQDIARSRAAEFWPQVQAEVFFSNAGGWRRWTEDPFRYRYEVAGVAHTSSRYVFGADFGSEAMDLAPGTRITARYDPEDHAESVIRTGILPVHGMAVALGAFLLWVGPAIWKGTR